MTLKAKRAKKQDALKGPEKFIKQYRSSQNSYAYYKNKVLYIVISRIKMQQDHELIREHKDLKN